MCDLTTQRALVDFMPREMERKTRSRVYVIVRTGGEVKGSGA